MSEEPPASPSPYPEFSDPATVAGAQAEQTPLDLPVDPSADMAVQFRQPVEVQFKQPETTETGTLQASEQQVAVDSLAGVVSYSQKTYSNGVRHVYGQTADGKMVHTSYDRILADYGHAGDRQGTKERFEARQADVDPPVHAADPSTPQTAPVPYAYPSQQSNVAPRPRQVVKRSLSEAAAMGKLRMGWSEETRIAADEIRSRNARESYAPGRPALSSSNVVDLVAYRAAGGTANQAPTAQNPVPEVTSLAASAENAGSSFASTMAEHARLRTQVLRDLLITREAVLNGTIAGVDPVKEKLRQDQYIAAAYHLNPDEFDQLINDPTYQTEQRRSVQTLESTLLSRAIQVEMAAVNAVLNTANLSPENRAEAEKTLAVLTNELREAAEVGKIRPKQPSKRHPDRRAA